MSLTDQARRVLASLEAKPDLFFEVLRIAQDEFLVAGPWEFGSTPGTARRSGPGGGLVGDVKPDGLGHYGWQMDGDDGTADTLLAACNALDLALTEQGYLLSGGICPAS